MSDQDVFETAEQATPAEQTAATAAKQQEDPASQPQDVFADQLNAITNEDGTPKYSNVAQALDSIPHAQKHIQTIESENATLKAELAKAQAARELLEKSAGQAKPASDALTPEQVAEITQKTIAEQSEAQRKAENVGAVNARFSELYGDKASAEMQKIAKDSGMSISEIRTLAEKSPLAVYRLAGITNQASPPPPRSTGQVVGDNFQPAPPRPADPKPVMGGADTKDMIANWRAAGEAIKQQG